MREAVGKWPAVQPRAPSCSRSGRTRPPARAQVRTPRRSPARGSSAPCRPTPPGGRRPPAVEAAGDVRPPAERDQHAVEPQRRADEGLDLGLAARPHDGVGRDRRRRCGGARDRAGTSRARGPPGPAARSTPRRPPPRARPQIVGQVRLGDLDVLERDRASLGRSMSTSSSLRMNGASSGLSSGERDVLVPPAPPLHGRHATYSYPRPSALTRRLRHAPAWPGSRSRSGGCRPRSCASCTRRSASPAPLPIPCRSSSRCLRAGRHRGPRR